MCSDMVSKKFCFTGKDNGGKDKGMENAQDAALVCTCKRARTVAYPVKAEIVNGLNDGAVEGE